MSHDPVNQPSHYTSHPCGLECIALTKKMSFCDGNAVKYLWRAGKKDDTQQDLKKALVYIRWARETPLGSYRGTEFEAFKTYMGHMQGLSRTDEAILAIIEGRLRTAQVILEAVLGAET